MVEQVGFEPTEPFRPPACKTGALTKLSYCPTETETQMTTVCRLCKNCETPFDALIKEVNRGNGSFCSQSCANSYIGRNRLWAVGAWLTCAYCGEVFLRAKSKLKQSKSGLFFCCREHKDQAQRIGGIEAIQPDHYGSGGGAHNYRNRTLSTYPHECTRCGYSDYPAILIAHHKDHDRSNNNISNLELLCPICHELEHKLGIIVQNKCST